MPWRNLGIVNQRTEFVLKSLDGKIVFRDLCKEYGISAKTGYKWQKRFFEEGLEGLHDQSRRPEHHPAELSEKPVCEMVRLKTAHPKWGPKKIRELYARSHDNVPSESSFKRVLDKAGLVKHRRKRRARDAQRLVHREVAQKPNDIWTVDFKGWWRINTRQRCEPLTIRDEFSRYLLAVQAMDTSRTQPVREQFERVFATYGLPRVIRSDNGSPFASVRAPLGLSRLSAWWVALGVDLDRIEPGHPEQNGGHERMHRDIRMELQGMIEGDLRDHQAAFDVWRKEFNWERPHEALEMKVPGEVYQKSPIQYTGEPQEIEYPEGMIRRPVYCTGVICLDGQKIFLSESLQGWEVGLKPTGPRRYEAWFDHLRLGELDMTTATMNWADQPNSSS